MPQIARPGEENEEVWVEGKVHLRKEGCENPGPVGAHKVGGVQRDGEVPAHPLGIPEVRLHGAILVALLLPLVPIAHEYSHYLMPASLANSPGVCLKSW